MSGSEAEDFEIEPAAAAGVVPERGGSGRGRYG